MMLCVKHGCKDNFKKNCIIVKTYTKNGVEYISHKDALVYYGCTAVTIKNWRENGRLGFYDLPLGSGRLYAVDERLREYHLGGERFDRKSEGNL